jgi:glycosyltransferase involved in cell wall biosynthesis
MKIAIDCRMLGASGVGVYLRENLTCFLDTPHEFLLFGDTTKLTPLTGARHNAEIAACNTKPFTPQELLFFPAALTKRINRMDAYFSPYFNVPGGITIPIFTTIHDVIFPDMPELTTPAASGLVHGSVRGVILGFASKAGLMARMWFYRRAFHRSKTVFTVSAFSKMRIEHHLGRETPVVVVYNGCPRHLAPLPPTENPVNRQKTSDILFTGNIKKHKGLAVLLRAFFAARAEGLTNRLVIVGDKDNFRSRDDETLAELERAAPRAVSFTGKLPDDTLKTYLTQSALLVQPSLYEGFGLPPLEAMMCGTKALISDIPVFRELYGDFPVTFFKPGDADDLRQKLMDLLHNKPPEPLQLPEPLRTRYAYEKTASYILREITRP